MATTEALHLPRGSLPIAQVRSELARIPADLRISFLDACRTGGRLKGVQRGPDFALASPAESARGTVELRASSIGEAAQESEELGGAIFTHFVLSGLRGLADLDGDRRVTVSELYAYVYRRTLFRTGSQGAAVLQHPAVMVDLSGAGEVVLSTPSSGAAALEVPAGPDRYLVFALPSAAVMGEIGGGDGRVLALPAGRFLVARRTPDRTAVTEVDLSWGGTRQLHDGDFRPVAREELVARGGHLELRSWRVAPSIGAEFAPGSSEGPAVRAGVMLGHNYGSLGVELEVSYVSGSFSNVAVDPFGAARGYSGWEHSVVLDPAVVLRVLRGPWALEGALGAELRYSWQNLVSAVTPDRRPFNFLSAGPFGSARASLSLGHHLALATTISFAALLRNERDSNNMPHDLVFHPVLHFAADLGYAF